MLEYSTGSVLKRQSPSFCWQTRESGVRCQVCLLHSSYSYDKLLLVLSEHSADSLWVKTEVGIATERELQDQQAVIYPIRLDDVVQTSRQDWVKSIRSQRHIEDFSNWGKVDAYQRGLARLLRGLRVEPYDKALP